MLILLVLILIFNLVPLTAGNLQWISGGSFNDVKVVNSNEIWFAGELLVHGYKDSNKIWHFQQKGSEITENNYINKIDFYTPKYGMALSGKYVFYTSDNGSNWIKYKLPDNYTFYDIKMIDENIAFACGKENIRYGQGIIAKTVDKGKTWKIVFKTDIYYGGSFYQIIMWNKDKGVAVGTFYDGWGSFGALFYTDNGWKNGYKTATVSSHDLSGMSSPYEDYVFYYGGDIASDPYIGFWHNNYRKDLKLPADITKIYNIYFDNETHGFAVGHYENKKMYEQGGVFLETFDGGETWERQDFPDYTSLTDEYNGYIKNLETIHFLAVAGNDYFVGQRYSTVYPCADRVCTGKVLHSNDKKNWEVVNKLSGFRYIKSYLFDKGNGELTGYFAGFDGNKVNSFFRKIQNSQLTTPHYFNYLCNLYDFYMNNEGIAWGAYCRDDNYKKFYLLYSNDAGGTWAKKEIKNFNDSFINSLNIAMSKKGDIILGIKSSDNYILKNIFTNPQKLKVYGINSLNYLDNGKICLIENFVPVCIDNQNQKNFIENIEDDKFTQFSYLKFIDDNTGYAVRKSDKAIFKTTDGAKSWTFTGRLPVDRDDVKVDFFDTNHGYLIYTNQIYYSNDSGLTWTELKDGVNPSSFSSVSFSKNYGAVAFTPSGMVIEKQIGEINYTKNYCAKFSIKSYRLYIPCIKINNMGFVAMFKLAETSPNITIQLENISQITNFNDSQNTCTTFNANTQTLHIPCLKLGDDNYKLDFTIRKIQPYVELLLTNFQKKE